MRSNEDAAIEGIIRRLNVLISLQLDQTSASEGSSIASKVERLTGLGLPASQVAEILGKPLNYVTAVRSVQAGRKRKRSN